MSEAKKRINEAGDQHMEGTGLNWTKKELLSRISHEIRTTMSAILGTSETQLQKDDNPVDITEALSTIYNLGNFLLNTTNDLMDLSKIEDGELELVPEKYDIPSLINDTMQLSMLRFESKPIEFLLSIDEDTPYDLYGDEHRVKQILSNILFNAYQNTERGKVELSIKAELQQDTSEGTPGSRSDFILIFDVSDTGYGMSEEEIESLFTEQLQIDLDAEQAYVDRGLGMSITKRLIDAMHGEISVKSKPGEGSIFTVRLPQQCIGSTKCGPELADELRGRRFQSMSKSRKTQIATEYMPYGSVLIVDDFESNRNVAKGIMLSYGLNIDTAASGSEALDKINSGAVYDIVFMDYMMPKMDGLETTRKIRDMGYTKPIVALTANVIKGQEELFSASGCDEHIYKPIDTRELNTLLNRLIRDKQPPEVVKAARQEMRKRKAIANRSLSQKTLVYEELLAATVRDAENALQVLGDVLPGMDAPDGSDIELFTATVHGIKSSLVNIDEVELMSSAHKLEKAGMNKVTSVILAETPSFMDALRSFVEKSKHVAIEETAEASFDDAIFLLEQMHELKKACEAYDIRAARAVMVELKKQKWPPDLKEIIDDISFSLIRGDFEKVVSNARKIEDVFLKAD